MTTVVSGFSPAGRIEYGEKFLETFDRFWPRSVRLLCFVEEPTSIPRGGERSLWSCPGVKEFIERHQWNPKYTGKEPLPSWRPKHRDHGYSYRHDAVKFCRQCFIPETAASELSDDEILVWLDGDVTTHQIVSEGFVEKLIGNSDICYLGRRGFHSELGFWAIRLNNRTRMFLKYLAALWRTDGIFRLQEWHSAFAFDYTRNLFQVGEVRIEARNLTPNGRGAVWQQSPLAQFTDHLKGRRKHELAGFK